MTHAEASALVKRLDAIEAQARHVEASITRIRRELQNAHRIPMWDYDPTKKPLVGSLEGGR